MTDIDPTTAAGRDALRRLADAASLGPWEVRASDDPDADEGDCFIYITDRDYWRPDLRRPDNAAFVAASRTAVPALLDALDRAEARIADLVAARQKDSLDLVDAQVECSRLAGELAAAQARIAELESDRDALRRDIVDNFEPEADRDGRRIAELDQALQSLTPGGSEYVNDPARCVAFVRGRHEMMHGVIVKTTLERNELRTRLAAQAEVISEARELSRVYWSNSPKVNNGIYSAAEALREKLRRLDAIALPIEPEATP